jgi:hypothetical protein
MNKKGGSAVLPPFLLMELSIIQSDPFGTGYLGIILIF